MTPIRRAAAALAVLALTTLGALAVAGPAQATATDDCKSVTVDLPERPDSGVHGNDWARNDLKRVMKVCALADPVEGAEPGTLWWYKATVTDGGTFVTLAGDSPNGTATVKAGVKGTVTGGFEATFTAPRAWGGWAAEALTGKTSTGTWVATAFPGAQFDKAGAVANWAWTYKTPCESWTNAEAGNSGEIAGKVCPAKVEWTKTTCKDATTHITVTNVNSAATVAVQFGDDNPIKLAPGKSQSYALTTGSVQVLVTREWQPRLRTGEPLNNVTVEYKAPNCPTIPPAAPGGTGGGSGPSLPVTGAGVVTAAGFGLLLVALGIGAVWLTRRRRTTFTT